MLNKEQRISAFVELGHFLQKSTQQYLTAPESIPAFKSLLQDAFSFNGWFDEVNVLRAFSGVITILEEKELRALCQIIPEENPQPKAVALIMAGNIPMVGFHDMLMVLLSGHTLIAKLSSDDKVLPMFLMDALVKIEPGFSGIIKYPEGKLENLEAVIATGSNNSSRYFEYYFSKYPHIIRKNRQSVAILKGDESTAQLQLLAKDIFYYYGLGCRNVSQLLVPKAYDFALFFESMFSFGDVINNNKYANNYDYNKAIYLLSSAPILDNNFLLLKPDNGISSPVAVTFQTEYADLKTAYEFVENNAARIQCVVGNDLGVKHVNFGETQLPKISEYADNIDTLSFLLNLR
jgi:hypothetical protein